MVRAVTKIELYGVNDAGDVRSFTCASGTKISKGDILKFATPRTASLSTGSADVFAGIASADKASDDYTTRVGCWENGIFEMTASQAITAGDKVQTAASAGNYVMTMGAASSQNIVIGIALKDAVTDGRVQVRVDN